MNWCCNKSGETKFIEWNPNRLLVPCFMSAKLLRYLSTIVFMYSWLIVSLKAVPSSSSMASVLIYFFMPSMSLEASCRSSIKPGLDHSKLLVFDELAKHRNLWAGVS
jgi:hypothetical protein